MELLTISLISIGLATDALAVSLGIGTAGQIASLHGKIRLAVFFGIFQSGMTALGWLARRSLITSKSLITGLLLLCSAMWALISSVPG